MVKVVQTTPASGEPDQTMDCEADVDQTTQFLKKLNWGSPVLTVEQKHQLMEFLLQNGDLFALDPSELRVINEDGTTRFVWITEDSTP